MAKSHPLDRLVERFATIPDRRVDRQRRHVFTEVIVLAIIGFLGNCNDWVAVERFAHARLDWPRAFLKLESGVPSHDAIGRIFALLSPRAFAESWEARMREVCERLGLKQVALDGKTMCQSGNGDRKALHVAAAFAAANGLSLAQEVVGEKSDEITAIPELLRRLDISRSLVTIDAMGCQKKIAAQIRHRKADYLLGVEGNQPKLLAAIEAYTPSALERGYVDIEHTVFGREERSHGRDESRTCYVFGDVKAMGLPAGWKNLKSVVMVVSERAEKGKSASEVRYYISSRKASAKAMLQATRSHW